jgi:hypothetical protein
VIVPCSFLSSFVIAPWRCSYYSDSRSEKFQIVVCRIVSIIVVVARVGIRVGQRVVTTTEVLHTLGVVAVAAMS